MGIYHLATAQRSFNCIMELHAFVDTAAFVPLSVQLRTPEGKSVFGVGMDGNISLASIKGIICAINRAANEKEQKA